MAEEELHARSCYAETFLVPQSSMTHWVMDARRVVMIDGCLLICVGRVLKNFVDAEKIIHIDALPMHKKFGDVFLYTVVPEDEQTEIAGQVADKILARLKDEIRSPVKNPEDNGLPFLLGNVHSHRGWVSWLLRRTKIKYFS